jgi:hypothetical protein
LFASKGLYASWDRLAEISSALDYLQKVKKEVGIGLRGYRSETHTTPDTSDLVWKVANNVRDTELFLCKVDRPDLPTEVTKVVNILKEGEKKLKSSSLKTFNHRLQVLQGKPAEVDGVAILEEQDELSPPDFHIALAHDDDL